MAVVVVALVAVVAGGLTAILVSRFPALDPAAPHLSRKAIAAAGEHATPRHGSRFVQSRVDREAVTGLLLTTALLIALAAAIAIGSLFAMAQHNALLARYDLSAARWGADNATSTSTRVLRDISLLGGTPVMIAVAVVAAIVEFARTRLRAVFAFVLTVVIGQVLLTNLTKYIVDRPRPNVLRLTGFSGSSFPSGHAATAAATFAVAGFLIGRGRSRNFKAVTAGVVVAIAAGVATTRVLLGVHWLTDVIAGLALGWGWFALCSIAFGGRVLRFGHAVDVAAAEIEHATARTPGVGAQ